jgi:hypothetical protein
MGNGKWDDRCGEKEGRYRCPRCLVPYCSVECFRVHSVECTEAFHRENVENALMAMRPSETEKRTMEGILVRHHKEMRRLGDDCDEYDSDENSDDEIKRRGMEVLHCALDILKMGPNESKDVEARELVKRMEKIGIPMMMQDSSSISHPSLQKPWWTQQRKLIEIHSEAQDAEKVGECPEYDVMIVPVFDAMSKVRPAYPVHYMLALAIFTYCFTWRRYGGDFYDLGSEVAALVFEFLESHGKPYFPSLVSVGDHCLAVLKKWSIEDKDEWNVIESVMAHDVRDVVGDRVYRVQALLDLRHHIMSIMDAMKGREDGDEKWRRRVQRALMRRIDYLIAYVRDVCQSEDMDHLLAEIVHAFQSKEDVDGASADGDGGDMAVIGSMRLVSSSDAETRKSAPKNPHIMHQEETSRPKIIEIVPNASSPSKSSRMCD